SSARRRAQDKRFTSTRAISRVRERCESPMSYTPILATLAYVLSPDGRRVLLIHRNRRPDDAHFGKYNGLGGKLDSGEDVVACLRREVHEEAGLECEELVLRGTISWPGFGKHGEDWFGFLFRVDRFRGTPRAEKPNVLVIAIDDLNDWVGCLGGHPQVQTPNMDRLARRGTLLLNAHCQAPLCNPSRTSVLTGLRPSTSGVYALNPWFRTSAPL